MLIADAADQGQRAAMTRLANTDAEAVVAGCLLREADAVDTARSILTMRDFTTLAAQTVFEAAASLRDAGTEPDAASVRTWLSQAGRLDDLGRNPTAYLVELLEAAPTAAHLDLAARQVREMSRRRALVRLGAGLMQEAVEPEPVEDVAGRYARQVADVAEDGPGGDDGVTAAADLMAAAVGRYDSHGRGERPAGLFPTGDAGFDGFLGGLAAGQLVVIGARPSVGKSALALRLAVRAARLGAGTLVFSLEMSRDEIADRIVAAEADVQLPRLRGIAPMTPDQMQRVADVASRVGRERWPIFVDDRAGRTAESVAALTRRYVRRHGVKVVLIDYLQLLRPDDPRAPRHLQVGAMSRRLKELARQAGVCVVVLAQLSRAVEGRPDGRPKLSDLRDSGEVEQDGDVVAFLHRLDDPAAPEFHTAAVWQADLIVAKNRNGPLGSIPLSFVRAFARFEDRLPIM